MTTYNMYIRERKRVEGMVDIRLITCENVYTFGILNKIVPNDGRQSILLKVLQERQFDGHPPSETLVQLNPPELLPQCHTLLFAYFHQTQSAYQ